MLTSLHRRVNIQPLMALLFARRVLLEAMPTLLASLFAQRSVVCCCVPTDVGVCGVLVQCGQLYALNWLDRVHALLTWLLRL